jgi:pimeloyl-ACP methyl ester carboxylesterase
MQPSEVLRPVNTLRTILVAAVLSWATLSAAPAAEPETDWNATLSSTRRPQTPTPPFPYLSEEVEYENAQHPGVHLAGTLTRPRGPGPFPAVLLITGSGAQDRDETVFGHKPFLVLADDLTRRGIAVLRVDDRGVGGSSGATLNDTSEDYATDVAAGVAFLKARKDIDPNAIGLVGHSEGALIATLVASKDPSIACLVFLAGPGLPGREVIVEQARAIALASGETPEAAEETALSQRAILDAALSESDPERMKAAVLETTAKRGLPSPHPGALSALTSAWYRFYVAYDPRPALRNIRMPVLALLGSKDVQVTAAQNLPALREALADNPRAEVRVLQGLNHGFQTAREGKLGEYASIEETIAPSALDLIGNWVTATLRK